MQHHAPLSSLAAKQTPTKKYKRFSLSKLIATALVAVSALVMGVAAPASAAATEPVSCDLAVGSVLGDDRLGLSVNVTNGASAYYNVVLFNQGPIGLQSPFQLSGTTLNGTYDKVDVGYSGRRAVEQGVGAAFTAAIAPLDASPTLENSTFCTGTVSLTDNAIDGTAFTVSH